jgi:hypothetical protein
MTAWTIWRPRVWEVRTQTIQILRVREAGQDGFQLMRQLITIFEDLAVLAIRDKLIETAKRRIPGRFSCTLGDCCDDVPKNSPSKIPSQDWYAASKHIHHFHRQIQSRATLMQTNPEIRTTEERRVVLRG